MGTGIIRAAKEVRDIEFVNDEGSQFQVIMQRPVDAFDRPSSVSEGSVISEGRPEYGYKVGDGDHDMAFLDIRSRCPALGKGEEENARRILAFCRVPQGILEMMEIVGYKSRTSFRRKVFTPLLEAGLLIPEYKDKPNSPKQRYCTANHRS